MDLELKGSVIPWLRAEGFKGSFPHFRRPRDSYIDLMTFQFDKWGGGFVIEIARCSSKGVAMYWGEIVPPSKVRAWDLNPPYRKRVVAARDERGMEIWFRFDVRPPNELAALVVEKLSRVAWAELTPGEAPR